MINWKEGNQVGFDLTIEVEDGNGGKVPKTMEVVGTLVKINPSAGTITVRYANPMTFTEGQIDILANTSEFREGTLF
jgi:hypothetical protein